MNDLQLFDAQGMATREAMMHARAQADDGMARALQHAEADTPGWSNTAMAYLHGYALSHDRFTGWMVTTSAELTRSVPRPATGKAWGAVIKKAARLKIIERDGVAKDPNRHGNLIPVWRSLVFKGSVA